MLDRLKLFLVVLVCESVGAAGLLALGSGARVKGAAFFGYGGFRFLLLIVLLGLAVISASLIYWLLSRVAFQNLASARLAVLRDDPRRYQSAVLISLSGAVLGSLLLLYGYIFHKGSGSIGAQWLPIVAFLVLLCLEIFILLAASDDFVEKNTRLAGILLLILLGFLMLGYLRGAFDFSKIVNNTPGQGGVDDQIVYMKMMATAYQNPLTYSGDGNRMPLFPLIEAIFYNPQAAYLDSFDTAKSVNIYLSLLVLAGLFVFFQKTWHSLFATVNLVLMAAFGIFIFKSAYFLPEVLFYFFGFMSFVFLARLFVQPSYKNALAAGIFTALAYLSKATALAAVAFFAVTWCFAILVGWLGDGRRSQTKHGNEESGQSMGMRKQQAGALEPGKLMLMGGTALAVFLGLLIPFGVQNSQKYGGFFNNINSNVVMWADSWSQYTAASASYGGAKAMLVSPQPGQPSLQNYILTHNLAQALTRLSQGCAIQLKNVLQPFNTVNYALVLLVVLVVVAASYPQRTLDLLQRYKALLLYVLCYLLGYFALFCWYGVIDHGPRFVLGLFLPLLFSIYAALFQYRDKLLLGINRLSVVSATNVFLLLLVCVDASIVLNSYLLTGQYGF